MISSMVVGLCLLCSASLTHEIYLPKGEKVPQKDRVGVHMQSIGAKVRVLEFKGLEVDFMPSLDGMSKWQDHRGKNQLKLMFNGYDYGIDKWNPVIRYEVGYRYKLLKISFIHEQNEVHYSDSIKTELRLW